LPLVTESEGTGIGILKEEGQGKVVVGSSESQAKGRQEADY